MTKPVGDMKAGLTSGARPKLSILPKHGLVHECRAIEYGADKYARGNYHAPPPAALGGGQHAAALRLLGYLDAAQRHITRVTDAINRALGTGGDLAAACATVDDITSAGFPASRLPDLAHALASLGIGVSCAVDDGLLPADPGQPWAAELAAMKSNPSTMHGKTIEEIRAAQSTPELAQKDDPAAERARVAVLQAQTENRRKDLIRARTQIRLEMNPDDADALDAVTELDREIARDFVDGRVRSEGVDL